jgi:hypothetical protein
LAIPCAYRGGGAGSGGGGGRGCHDSGPRSDGFADAARTSGRREGRTKSRRRLSITDRAEGDASSARFKIANYGQLYTPIHRGKSSAGCASCAAQLSFSARLCVSLSSRRFILLLDSPLGSLLDSRQSRTLGLARRSSTLLSRTAWANEDGKRLELHLNHELKSASASSRGTLNACRITLIILRSSRTIIYRQVRTRPLARPLSLHLLKSLRSLYLRCLYYLILPFKRAPLGHWQLLHFALSSQTNANTFPIKIRNPVIQQIGERTYFSTRFHYSLSL